MDGGAWWAAVHGVTGSQTRLTNLTFTFPFHASEKDMATHSSVLFFFLTFLNIRFIFSSLIQNIAYYNIKS